MRKRANDKRDLRKSMRELKPWERAKHEKAKHERKLRKDKRA